MYNIKSDTCGHTESSIIIMMTWLLADEAVIGLRDISLSWLSNIELELPPLTEATVPATEDDDVIGLADSVIYKNVYTVCTPYVYMCTYNVMILNHIPEVPGLIPALAKRDTHRLLLTQYATQYITVQYIT